MHPSYIRAAVELRGLTLSQVSRSAGLSKSACGYALRHPSKRAEAAILAIIGLHPHEVWPDRYDASGLRNVRRGAPAHRDGHVKPIRHRSGKQ